ncbi:transmembrane protein 91-like [Sceloporus undulatus]|uniref:transmembrane protein 91-like n=1 Tax=Sceloporus undulatus TaxID=8520 RepID=UPI001C4D8B91|nr:transmembrane protein 91-like [Sceloporus undulatus]
MSTQNYEEIESNASATNTASYAEMHSYQESVPLKLPVRPPPPMAYGAGPPPVPPQYQTSYGPPDAQFSQGSDFQSQQAIFITPLQPTKEPDNLIYSIFTLMCCFLPLGIAAFVFSIKTQEANRNGNATAARKNSRLSRMMAHIAFGSGLVIWTLYITILTIRAKKHSEMIDLILVNLSTSSP